MDDTDSLISFVASVSGEGGLRVEEHLGEGFVRLRVSEAERRQAKHDIQQVEDIVIELLRNARDADATKIYVATAKEGDTRTCVVIDDGKGVPDDMRERIFEARVTSKLDTVHMDRWGLHGRGMALFSIRQNATTAEVVASGSGLGSAFRVVVDTTQLPERADQSTWPATERDEAGRVAIARGPHNIIRTVCEFALEERSSCDVYLGSPAEICATLLEHARKSQDAARLLFLESEAGVSVHARLVCAVDAADFMRIASSIGLDISERTAHRIFAGQIEPLRSVSSRLLRERASRAGRPAAHDLSRDARGLHVAQADLASFSRAVEADFQTLASKYYLYLQGEPKIKVQRDRITVVLDVGKEDC